VSERPELPETRDPYVLLDVAPGCGLRELKRAYLERIRVYRPDESPDAFQRIRAAFEVARAAERESSAPRRALGANVRLADHADAGESEDTWSERSVAPFAPRDAEGGDARFRADVRLRVATGEPADAALVAASPRDEKAESPRDEKAESPHDEKTESPHDEKTESPHDDNTEWSESVSDGRGELLLDAGRTEDRAGSRLHGLTEDAALRGAARELDVDPGSVPGPEAAFRVRVDAWVRAIDDGTDLSPRMRELDAALLDALAARGCLTWHSVRTQPRAELAARLFAEGGERRIVAGEGVAVLDELASGELARDMLGYPALESAVHALLPLLCWEDAARVRCVLNDLPPDPGVQSTYLDWLDRALPVAERWCSLRTDAAPTRAFEGLLRYGLLDSSRGRAVAERAASDIGAAPGAWLHSIDVAQAGAAGLGELLVLAADRWVAPDDRLWDELVPSERAWVVANASRLEGALERNAINTAHSWLVGVGLLGTLASFFFVGWWGVAVLAVWMVAVMVSTGSIDARIYRQCLRPLILQRFVARGISPDRLLEAMAVQGRWDDHLGRFGGEIRADGALGVLAAVHRLRAELDPGGAMGTVLGVRGTAAGPQCVRHPDKARAAVCAECGRSACDACTVPHPLVAAHCVDCKLPRAQKIREHCLGAERTLYAFANVDFLLVLASVMLALYGGDAWAAPASAIAGAAALAMLCVGLGLWTRRRWSRTAQTVLLLPLFAAIPLGPFVAMLGIRRLYATPMASVLAVDYLEVMRATPELGPGRFARQARYVIFALLAVIVAPPAVRALGALFAGPPAP
jgi:hypothetical protein